MDTNLIERLARLRGIGDAYHDYRGDLRYFSLESKSGILRAMGCSVDDPVALAAEIDALEIARSRMLLPAVAAARGPRIGLDLNIAARDFGASMMWTVNLEDGSHRSGVISTGDCPETWRGEVVGAWITRRRFEVPVDLPPGYHELELKVGNSITRCLLVMSPLECFEPQTVITGARLWGVAVQLYTLRSRDNWGIGDFADLKRLIRWLAPQGAGFIGLNPLHALAPADPARSSPYSASSRHFLNVLYIAVPEVAEFSECAAAQERMRDPNVVATLNALRDTPWVNYQGVADLKFEILGLLFKEFTERHLNTGSARAQDFRAFVAGGGPMLQAHARFDALDHHFRTTLMRPSGWLNWPEEFRDVDGAPARHFGTTHPLHVEFFLYLQWIAHEQLVSAQALTRELGMTIGLYGDYAVGANPGGSETWFDRENYRMGAEIGAPPDPLALRGQGWGIPPQDPVVLVRQRLQSFIRLIRNNMRYYGALRLDHVMSLFRLWWVAAGHSPTDGAYVHYPLEQLLSVLAVESNRAACLVVGEDLGVVPDEMRRAMPEYGIYHYKVLLFEKLNGRFRRPEEFTRRALATVTTHDMPTLRSYWDGLDIDLRSRLGSYPNQDVENEVRFERSIDRSAVLAALDEQALRPVGCSSPDHPFSPELAHALHLYLARSSTVLAALQIEDLLGMIDPVNVPGTDREYPNWQRKLTADLEDIETRADLAESLRQIGQARGG